MKKKEMFDLANAVMQEYYPEHEWNDISIDERFRIWNRPPVPSPDYSGHPDDSLREEIYDLIIKVLRRKETRRTNEKSQTEN